eukprot:10548106-Heterocapsa_arctica.AAC.1
MESSWKMIRRIKRATSTTWYRKEAIRMRKTRKHRNMENNKKEIAPGYNSTMGFSVLKSVSKKLRRT